MSSTQARARPAPRFHRASARDHRARAAQRGQVGGAEPLPRIRLPHSLDQQPIRSSQQHLAPSPGTPCAAGARFDTDHRFLLEQATGAGPARRAPCIRSPGVRLECIGEHRHSSAVPTDPLSDRPPATPRKGHDDRTRPRRPTRSWSSCPRRRSARAAARGAGGLRRRHGLSARHRAPPRADVDRAHPRAPAGARSAAIARRYASPTRGAPSWPSPTATAAPTDQWWHQQVPSGMRRAGWTRAAGRRACSATTSNSPNCTCTRTRRATASVRRCSTRLLDGRAERSALLSTPEVDGRGQPRLAAVSAARIHRRRAQLHLRRRQPPVRGARAAVPCVATRDISPVTSDRTRSTLSSSGQATTPWSPACYLARSGLVGRGARTRRRPRRRGVDGRTLPGYQVDRGSSAHIMIRHTGIVEELELGRVGLRYLDCDPWAFAPAAGESGAGIVFHRCLDATCRLDRGRLRVARRRRLPPLRRRVGPAQRRRACARSARPPTAGARSAALVLGPRRAAAAAAALSREFLQSGDALLDE